MGWIIFRFRWKSIAIVISIALAITLADQVSVKLFKNVFERLRPCHNESIMHLVHTVNNKCGGQFGFVSSHAANTFALASILYQIIKKQWFTIMIFCWAGLVAYSRIYLGVHYPADIAGGALLGVLIGWAVYLGYSRLPEKWR
ncbi:MAG: phosphatase PAP2 family protein [Bacteroidales bacterium]|nr:phosphatase PAP2 family protein [Bacteroidales bacterium]